VSLAALLSFTMLAAPAGPPDPPPPQGVQNADASTPPVRRERTAPNLVFFEPLGNGLFYSLNYERIIGRFGLRGGASFFTWAVSKYGGSGNLTLVTVPLVASYYVPFGETDHHAELGLGATVLYLRASTDSEGTSYGGARAGFDVAATAVIGYRYLPRKGGLTFGAAFTPLVRTTKLLPWGGLSAGYVF
jgi:hypothetical protein